MLFKKWGAINLAPVIFYARCYLKGATVSRGGTLKAGLLFYWVGRVFIGLANEISALY
ncbi:hypothetical protein [Bacillus mycoides]|uniref:hypothetical protein n=1 Tax=Bacillus mycoides TaxID=1405 RepID=UPI0018798EED|nr:hypothetical protein [Bacillus mycoides]